MSRRVVITGIGTVSALGIGVAPMWEAMLAGRSGLGRPTRVDLSGFTCSLAGEVRDFSARDFVPKHYRKAVKVMARDTELAVAAAKLAIDDAGIRTRAHAEPDAPWSGTYPASRMGCQIGAGLIAAETLELTSALATACPEGIKDGPGGGFSLRAWGTINDGGGGMNNLQPLWMLKYLPNMLACHVTIIHGCEGPSNTITCAEASGLLSLGETLRVIQRGGADVCLSGGAESKLSLMGVLRQRLAGRLGSTGEAATNAGVFRPYDPGADGSVVGEGGGILVLEERGAAAARGAKVYAEVLGFGAAQATPFIPPTTRPDRSVANDGLVLAIRAALKDAGVGPEGIDAIVPQALGAPDFDLPEALALREIFGDRLPAIPLVTVTGYTGDCVAGMGALTAAVGAKCLQEQKLPSRLHAGVAMPGLNVGVSDARESPLDRVLVCSSSQGGQCAAVVLGRAGGKD